jgi:hypothetical protein
VDDDEEVAKVGLFGHLQNDLVAELLACDKISDGLGFMTSSRLQFA